MESTPYRPDSLNVQSLVVYFEARFKAALRAMARARATQLKKMCKCLHQELVSLIDFDILINLDILIILILYR